MAQDLYDDNLSAPRAGGFKGFDQEAPKKKPFPTKIVILVILSIAVVAFLIAAFVLRDDSEENPTHVWRAASLEKATANGKKLQEEQTQQQNGQAIPPVDQNAPPAVAAMPAPNPDGTQPATAAAAPNPLPMPPPAPPPTVAEATATANTPILPPPAAKLMPIDPNAIAEHSDVSMDDINMGAAPGSVMPNHPADAAKTVQAVAAVNDILGKPAIMTPAAQKTLNKQVEVTPHAREAIIVHKTYSAQSGQAIDAAGDRVMEAGQYGAAVEIYNKQLAKNPSDPLSLAGKAMALQRAGRDDEAMSVYKRLLDKNPHDVDALTNYLGLLQKQNPDQALAKLNTLSQQYPDNAAISGQSGMIYAGMMDTPNALRAFLKAQALDPTNPTYPFNLGVLYDRLGTTEKARFAYMQALNLVRNNPDKGKGIDIDAIRSRLGSLSN